MSYLLPFISAFAPKITGAGPLLPGAAVEELPSTAAIWNATYPDITAPDSIWTFQELAPGDRDPAEVEGTDPSAYDTVGSQNLIRESGTIQYQLAGANGRVRMEPEGASVLGLADSTAFEADHTKDISFLFKLKIDPGSSATYRALFGKASSTEGYSLRYLYSMDRLQLWYNPTAGGNAFISLDGVDIENTESLVGLSLNLTAGSPRAYLYTPTHNGSVATPIEASVGNPFRIGTVTGVASGGSPEISYGCAWSNRHLTLAEYNTIEENSA